MRDNPGVDGEEQLAAIERIQQRMAITSRSGARQLGALCILLGIALGALHVLLHFFTPSENLPGFFVLCAFAALVILAAILWYQKAHRVLPRGLVRPYFWSLSASLLLYCAALALIEIAMTGILTGLIGLVVALPLILAGWWMAAR